MKSPSARKSYRFASLALCFTLLLQTSGIAEALPAMPEPTWVSQSELEAWLRGEVAPETETGWGRLAGLLDDFRGSIGETWAPLAAGLETGWQRILVASSETPAPESPPVRIASAVIPAAVALAVPSALQDDREPRAAGRDFPATPPKLPERSSASISAAGTSGLEASPPDVPLLPGFNLISIPNEPPDPDPAAVLGPIAGQVAAAFAYDACDLADPWKIYDPADPGGSDLAAIDHRIGVWLDATASTVLPVAGTQPAATQIQLCTGWNLIGYPLAQARPVPAALASIAGKYVRVFGFDVADLVDPWEVFSVGVPAWANDLQLMQPGRGYWVLATENTVLDYENVGAPPVVEITAPSDLAEVTAPAEVIGTIESNSLDRWTLSYRPSGEPAAAFVEIGSGNVPGTGLSLGSFDPTLLLNGMYDLKVEAVDFAGQIVADVISVVVEGQMKVGHFTLSFIDLVAPVSGLDIEIVRTYDSRDRRQREFGFGWTLDVLQGTYRNNRMPGDGWQILEGFLPCENTLETKSHLTAIRLSDQEMFRFRLQLFDAAITLGGCFAKARFDFVDGPTPASLEILGNDDVFYENAGNRVIDIDTFDIYEPPRVRLVTRDGRSFDLDIDAGVAGLSDLNGNELTITPLGITHSSGRSIAFDRDGTGRITRITDPEGNPIVYGYDGSGDLAAVTDRTAAITRFTYNADHFLLDIEDPRGVTGLRNEYDEDGRLVRHIDASGKVIELAHLLNDRREVITDRLGRIRILEYDERGNVVREIDAEGNTVLATYDATDRLLSRTDPLGGSTTHLYNSSGDLLSVEDPLGHTTSYTYDGDGRVLIITDPRGKVTSHTYDGSGNLLSTTDPLGNVTSSTYDGSGHPLTATDAMGNVTHFEYDTFGNLTRRIDALGTETTFTYDSNGNQLTRTTSRTTPSGPETLVWNFAYDAQGRLAGTTFPDGSTSSMTYDPLGKIAATIDALGRITSFTYDQLGRTSLITYPDGTIEQQGYDDEGRVVTEIDRGGRVTSFDYDVASVLTTTFADHATISSVYDDAGRLIAETDGNGNTTTFQYDAAGRQIGITDALDQQTTFIYDAGGNPVSITDPLGNALGFVYDDAGRQVRVIFPDSTEELSAYDALGRLISVTDPAGKVTQFGYDALGRLISVTDALSQVTSYTYDKVGGRISQTDADGRVTRFEYDSLGRPTCRILPDGTAATRVYDAAGNLASFTSLAGDTTSFTYDAVDRPVEKRLPGGGGATFTYTSAGRRSSATDARGTTTYAYDARDRLVEVTYPDSRRLTYTFDGDGNRTSLVAHLAAETLTTTYTYDALDRLVTVTDPRGRVYTHTYDAAGNRASLDYPNGLETTYDFDAVGRLTQLATRTGVGDVVQSHIYTLGSAGQRTGVDEADGTNRQYVYDDIHRLTRETVSDVGGGLVFDDAFTYDPVGNRLGQTRTDPGGSTPVTYTYDDRDRLLTGDGTTFSWDADGRLIDRSGASAAAYTWDFEDRLLATTLNDGTMVAHVYDVDGNRVGNEITPPGGPATVTSYLVDPAHYLSRTTSAGLGLSQMVCVTDATGDLVAYYTRGHELLSVDRSSESRYHHTDGIGSIRVLSDEAGDVTDRYDYSAFGELLSHTGTDPQPYGFAGEPVDTTSGLAYHRARWLDPRVGRFASMDPFGGSILDPSSLHRYLYAAGDPVNRVDPTGAFGVSASLVSIAVIGILATIAMPRPAFASPGKQIQITIDDGPLGANPSTRALLKRHKIKTMYFVVGQEASSRPQYIKAIIGEGHTLGNHSWMHENLTTRTKEQIQDSLTRTDEAVRKGGGGGMTPNWRAPGGNRNDAVLAATAGVGYTKHWSWDIDSLDSNRSAKGNHQKILNHIRQELRRCAKPRCQILFHDFTTSVETLKLVLPALEKEGHTFVNFP